MSAPAVSVPGLGIANIPNAAAGIAASAAGPAAQIGALPQAQALGVEAAQKNPAFAKVFDKALGGQAESASAVSVPSMGASAAGPSLSASTAKSGGMSAKSPASPRAAASAGSSWTQKASRWLKAKVLLPLGLVAAIAGCGGDGSSHSSSGGYVDPDYVEYSNGHAIATVPYDGYLVSQEDALINRINDYRLSIGLLPLNVDPTLGDVARGDAKHMDQHEYVSTITPEGDTFTQRVDLTYGSPVYFENAETVMADWTLTDDYWAFEEMYWDYDASTLMEDPFFTDIGVGRRSNPFWSRSEGWAVGYGEY